MWTIGPRAFFAAALAAAIGLALGAIALFLGPCQRRPAAEPGKAAPQALELKKDEKAKVVIDTRRREVIYAVRNSSGVVVSKVVEEVRHATVVVKDNGDVEVSARRWGFGLEPGLALLIDQGPRPAGDLRFFYFGNWGADAGIYYRSRVQLYLSGSYELGRIRLFNTSLWAGFNLEKEIVFGLRVGF